MNWRIKLEDGTQMVVPATELKEEALSPMPLTSDATQVSLPADPNIPEEVRHAHTGKPGPWKEAGVLRGGPKGKPGKYDDLSMAELGSYNHKINFTDNDARQEFTRRERLMKYEPLPFTPDELQKYREEIDDLIQRLPEGANSGPRIYGLQMREWQKRGAMESQARVLTNSDMLFSG
jgi:hypothetical protein